MMFSTGLLGEVLMRTYFESQGRRIYAVREIRAAASRSRPRSKQLQFRARPSVTACPRRLLGSRRCRSHRYLSP